MIQFTQGHFEELAEALQQAKRTARNLNITPDQFAQIAAPAQHAEIEALIRSAYLDGITFAQGEIAAMAKRSNGRFDAGRFARACELGANVKNRTR